MRIIIISPYPPYRGGIAHFTIGLEKHLKLAGHEVCVITFIRQYPFGKYGKLDSDNNDSNRWIDTLNPYTWLKVGAEIVYYKPDLVIFAYWHPYFAVCYSFIAKIVHGGWIKILILSHNIKPHDWFPCWRVLTKWFLSHGDYHIVLSDAAEKDLIDIIPSIRKG